MMTAREMAAKLLALDNPDIPVALLVSRGGSGVDLADPKGDICGIKVIEPMKWCSLAPGDHPEVLVLHYEEESL